MTVRTSNRVWKLWLAIRDHYTANRPSAMPYLGPHGLDHIVRVWRNSIDISAYCQGASQEIIDCGAIVHDLGYAFLTSPETGSKEHIQLSIDACPAFLGEAGFQPDEIRAVQGIVALHHQQVEHASKPVEAQILYVADKLDLVGFDGTLREIMRRGDHRRESRDALAQQILARSRQRVEDLLDVGVGQTLVKLRWAETQWLLGEILVRGDLGIGGYSS